jgi:hypothetical protein
VQDEAAVPEVAVIGTGAVLSGAITRLGRYHGMPTPANQARYALLGVLDRQGPWLSASGPEFHRVVRRTLEPWPTLSGYAGRGRS